MKKYTDLDRMQSFWRRVYISPSSVCWNWNGGKFRGGYGQIWIGNKKSTGVHRFSYTIHFGKIPDNLHVLHTCDNRTCVNPKHLYLGTNDDNVKDRMDRNRSGRVCGSKNWNSKLDEDKVKYIRKLIDDGIPSRKIASMFNICKTSVLNIKHNRIWVNV